MGPGAEPEAVGARTAARVRPELARANCSGLLILGASSSDVDLAPFVRGSHLGRSLFLISERDCVLAPLTAMEREEAEKTGHQVLSAEALDLVGAARESRTHAELLATVALRMLAFAGMEEQGTLGLAGSLPSGLALETCRLLEANGWRFVSGHDALEVARKCKDANELTEARRVASLTCSALSKVAELLRSATADEQGHLWLSGRPITPGFLRGEVAASFAVGGLGQPRGSIIAPGEEGAVPHNAGSDSRRLRTGESLVVDLFPKSSLFADCTRTFCVGQPSEPLRDAHGAVRDALALAHRECRPGVSGWGLQQEVCKLFEQDGYATPISAPGTESGYVHGLGHGVGLELHELPSFRDLESSDVPERAGLVEVGDLLTLEPGLYDPDKGFGVRLEDLVSVGVDGNEVLTPLPLEMDPGAWRHIS